MQQTQTQTSVFSKKCAICEKEGTFSTLHPSSFYRTTLTGTKEYYDEQGKYHVHSNNTRTQDFTCSKGHRYEVSSKQECWCGWGSNRQEIKVSEGTGIKSGIVTL